MKYFFAYIAFSFSLSLSAQERKLHSPAELLKIGIDSKITYNIMSLEAPVATKSYEKNLLFPDYYRVEEQGKILVKKYDVKGMAKAHFDIAERAFQNKDLSSARENYLKANSVDPGFSLALTYAGQVCEHSGNYSEAEALLKRSINQNYIDYLAHWFLADVYEHNGAIALAKEEIVIAHILNRNNPRIMEALNRILAKAKLRYDAQWQFNPQIDVHKTDTGIAVAYYGREWLVYAMANALWEFEPGYKESMGLAADDDISFCQDREKEGLIAVMMSAKNEKKKDISPTVKALMEATEEKMFQEYLFYEVWLPKRPDIALQLPEKFIKEIAAYVLKVRCDKG